MALLRETTLVVLNGLKREIKQSICKRHNILWVNNINDRNRKAMKSIDCINGLVINVIWINVKH